MSDARIDGYARALFEVARAEGTIDEVAVYDRALTESEVRRLSGRE